MNNITAAAMMPHPPIILPNIGKGEEKAIADIDEAMKTAAKTLLDTDPDAIVIISPHAPAYFDYIQVSNTPHLRGDMGQFGDYADSFDFEGDLELAAEIDRLCQQEGLPAGTYAANHATLDHGTMVPMYYLKDGMKGRKLVRISIGGPNARTHYQLGTIIAKAARNLGKKVAVIGSGDLSHGQKAGTHYGYKPEGPAYDARIMDIMGKGDFLDLVEIPEAESEEAMVCGQKPFAVMAGTMDGLKPTSKALAHSAEFGVGYGICTYTDMVPDDARNILEQAEKADQKAYDKKTASEDEYVAVARNTINNFITYGKVKKPADLPEGPGACFVSIHKDGQLRGCIGTTEPTTDNLASEIMQNAISASTRDPRFPAVQPWELEDLDINVDVLSPAEAISSPSELDPKKYGVIVTKGSKRGLLLPDLEGVDTVKKQLEIAKQKAGISPDDSNVSLERFTVVRHK